MTDVEQLVVAIRTALDEARQDAIEAMTRGAEDWGDYRYYCGLHDAYTVALERANAAFRDLAKDEA